MNAGARSDDIRDGGGGLRDGYAALPNEDADVADGGVGGTADEVDTGGSRLLLASFLILGAAVLLPFNAVITPSEFYRLLFRGTAYQSNFMSWIIVVYNISCIVVGAHATASMPTRSVVGRIRASIVVCTAVLLVATLASTFISPASSQSDGRLVMAAILILTTAISAATAYLQVAVVTLANAFGPSFLGTMLAGQGVVGVVVSSVQLFSAYTHAAPSGADVSVSESAAAAHAATAFFGANTAMMSFALLCFWRLQKTRLFGRMHDRIEEAKQPAYTDHHEHLPTTPSHTTSSRVDGLRRYMSPGVQRSYDRISSAQRKSVLSSFCIAYIFVITLSVFPSLTSRVRPTGTTDSGSSSSSSLADSQILIFVAWHFVTFNVSDLLGRTLPALVPSIFCIERLAVLCTMCVARTALPALLTRCNVLTSDGPVGASAVTTFATPVFFTLVVLLGLSNGMLATNVFVAGPRQPGLTSDAERSLVAGLLSWWLTVGLAIGSISSFFIAS